jgi:hypothetical protein
MSIDHKCFPRNLYARIDSFHVVGRIAGRMSEVAMGGAGNAQRAILRINEPKITCARSARARTRGENTLV